MVEFIRNESNHTVEPTVMEAKEEIIEMLKINANDIKLVKIQEQINTEPMSPTDILTLFFNKIHHKKVVYIIQKNKCYLQVENMELFYSTGDSIEEKMDNVSVVAL